MTDRTARPPSLALELVLLALLATLWGASYSFIKIGVETIPPVTLIAVRTLIAGALLLLVMRLRRVRFPKDRRLWLRFLVQACLNSVIPFTLIAWAEQTVDAGLATILNSTSPIFTFLLAAAILRFLRDGRADLWRSQGQRAGEDGGNGSPGNQGAMGGF